MSIKKICISILIVTLSLSSSALAFDLNEIFKVTSVSQLDSLVYPSGLKLPTNYLTGFDVVSDEDALIATTLLKHLFPKVESFTSTEIASMASYFNLMKLKSVSMGLPEYSVDSILTDTVLDKDASIEVVSRYEDVYGAILFIDTEWVSLVEKSYKVDLSSCLYKPDRVSTVKPYTTLFRDVFVKVSSQIESYEDSSNVYYDNPPSYPNISPFVSNIFNNDSATEADRLLSNNLETIGLKVIKSEYTPSKVTKNIHGTPSNSIVDVTKKLDKPFSFRDCYTTLCVVVVTLAFVAFIVYDYLRNKRNNYRYWK